MALLDAGVDALKASADPKDKDAVAKSLGALKTTTMAGKVDFTSGPLPNVSPGPIIGTQWVKAKAGSKFKLDYRRHRACDRPERADRAKLVPYNQK